MQRKTVTQPVQPAVDDRNTVLEEAARRLRAFAPHVIEEPGHSQEGERLARDLVLLALIFDKVFRSYGDYATRVLGMSRAVVDHDFAQPVLNAIQGRATLDVIRANETYREDFL